MRFERFIFVIMIVLLCGEFAYAAFDNYGGSRGSGVSVKYQPDFQRYYGDRISTYYPILNDPESCFARQDLLIQAAPFGCQPAVVRSDLVAEQNVPVFCQLQAFKLNPLVDIKQIRSIGFSGDYPKEVAGVGYHPAKAALRTNTQLLGSAEINNIGYVVVVLKKNPDEKSLPDFVNFTLKARVDYYAGNALGVGASEFRLQETSDEDWQTQRYKQSFFNGRYSLRLEEVDVNFATVSVYQGDRRVSTARIERGKGTSDIYVPGSYCQFGLKVFYDGSENAGTTATLRVDDDIVEVGQNSRFLNNKCSVYRIGTGLSNESVEISCGGERFVLSTVRTYLSDGTEVYVKDYGSVVPSNIQTVSTGEEGKVKGIIRNIDISRKTYRVELQTGATKNFRFEEVTPVNTEVLLQTKELTTLQKEKYVDALNTLKRVADNYQDEPNPVENGEKKNGEDALFEAIELAREFGQEVDEVELIRELEEKYPKSEYNSELQNRLGQIYTGDFSEASVVVNADDEYKTVTLISVNEPTKKSSAVVYIGGRRTELQEGQSEDFGAGEKVVLKKVLENSIQYDEYCKDNRGEVVRTGNSRSLNFDETDSICGQSIKLDSTRLEKFAKVRVVPSARTTGEVNFSVGVGIEKRAIKITPEKAKERIDELNKTIAKWDSISAKMGEGIKGLKAACFATSGVLTVKNFFTGLSGEAIARQQVMRGAGGWTERCAAEVGERKYGSVTECYNAHSSEINRDVSQYAKSIKQTNEQIAGIEAGCKSKASGFFGGDIVDRDNCGEILKDKLQTQYGNEKIKVGDKELYIWKEDNLENSLIKDNSSLGYEQMRDLYNNLQLKNSGGLSSVGTERNGYLLGELGSVADENNKLNEQISYSNDIKNKGYASPTALTGFGASSVATSVVPVNNLPSGSQIKGDKVTHASTIVLSQAVATETNKNPTLKGGTYILGLSEQAGNNYQIEKVVEYDSASGREIGVIDRDTFVRDYRIGSVVGEENLDYKNSFAKGEAVVKYYETEPYKGMPAIVPLGRNGDRDDGWYVATKQTLSGFGGIKAFESSGRPVSFWLCNVMEDGRIGFYSPGFGGDQCAQFNLETGQPLNKFPALSESETRRLVEKGVRYLNTAASQRASGRAISKVQIDGNTFDVGSPAANVPGTQCQDFMSPDECKLLFNVCDPVICPSSRCDLGGLYPVADVVQTGIVGSALLCLPNARDGVAVPVCLTGIKAGIDGYLSILKSHQACLQESIESGESVGTCDLITSVYTCEFFWRQAAPVANILLPKLVEFAYTGGSVRGGGEYLNVQSAWDNAQQSVNYFTQTYAVNSLEAFRIRSIEEAGTPICRAFVSAKGPKSFETLIEPDSPTQFHAWFSEIKFSDATVPATSQYKVFYHIFAGDDRGVAYNVYLKDAEGTSFYNTPAYITVASGFIQRGQYATATRDFTAPAGYKQLCVRYNDKEECGFKQVSSSFAVNYVRDGIVKDELAKKDIVGEKECVSGTPNLASVLNPNVGEAANEFVDPSVFNRGIVRICATENPGTGTEPERFVEVGQCDDKAVKCWLDKQSVDEAITANNKGVRNSTLQEIEKQQKEILTEQGKLLSDSEAEIAYGQFGEDIKKLKDEKDNVKARNNANVLLEKVIAVREKVWLNSDKARLLLIEGRVKKIIAQLLYSPVDKRTVEKSDVNTQENRDNPPAIDGSSSESVEVCSPEKAEQVIEDMKKKSSVAEKTKLIEDFQRIGCLTDEETEAITGKIESLDEQEAERLLREADYGVSTQEDFDNLEPIQVTAKKEGSKYFVYNGGEKTKIYFDVSVRQVYYVRSFVRVDIFYPDLRIFSVNNGLLTNTEEGKNNIDDLDADNKKIYDYLAGSRVAFKDSDSRNELIISK